LFCHVIRWPEFGLLSRQHSPDGDYALKIDLLWTWLSLYSKIQSNVRFAESDRVAASPRNDAMCHYLP